MRNPNGFGSVINLGKNRRKPFAVRITAGYNAKNGKQIFKYLGYFKTKSEAMKCLSEYNLNPYDADFKKISFEEVFLSFYELQKKTDMRLAWLSVTVPFYIASSMVQ